MRCRADLFLGGVSSTECQLDMLTGASRQGDEHVQAELVAFAAHQIGNARLAYPQTLGRFCLRPPVREPRVLGDLIAIIVASSGEKPRSAKTLPLLSMMGSVFMPQPPICR